MIVKRDHLHPILIVRCIRGRFAMSTLRPGEILLRALSLTRLFLDLLPDLSCPKLAVGTVYPRAAPTEVEMSVTVPIEGALSTLSGLRRMGLGEPGRGIAGVAGVPVGARSRLRRDGLP